MALNQRKTKEYVRRNLYRIDSLFVRSEEEAATLAANCRVSARALIMRAEAKSDLPAESWSGFYRALDKEDARLRGSWREKLRESMRALHRHRRLAIGSLILALALAFFTLVPAGRAIAESIFNYVIGVFDSQLEIEQAEEKALYDARGYDVPEVLTQEQITDYGYDEEGNLVLEKEPIYYDTVAAFEAVYHLDAFEFVSDQFTCIEVIENNHAFTGKSLRSNYRTPDDLNVHVIEQWYTGDGTSINFRGEVKQKEVFGGRIMTYAIDTENGSFDGFVLLENSILWIYADKGVDLDLIWEQLS